MKIRVFLIILLVIFTLTCICTCRQAGLWLVKENKRTDADAVVILMGSIADRVLEASDLNKLGLIRKVIIVEASMGSFLELQARGIKLISNTEQVSDALVSLGIPSENITILPGGATSTQMEANIIGDYVTKKPNFDTLILVSSAEHMRRASMIFKAALGNEEKPVTILCSPSKYTDFNAKHWWKDKEGIQRVVMEYLKIFNFYVFEKRKLKNKN